MDSNIFDKYFKIIKYCYFHQFDKSRIISILSYGLSIIGTISTLLGLVVLIFDKSDNTFVQKLIICFQSHFALIVCIVFAISFLIKKKKQSIVHKFSNTDISVIVEFCDIFKQNGAIVVPVMDTFDTDLSKRLVNPKTIHGQFINTFYSNNISDLDNQIEKKLKENNGILISNEENLIGKKERYKIGATCEIYAHSKHFYLTALTNMNPTGNVNIQPQYIQEFLSCLWLYILNNGVHEDYVNLPVIGSGINRLPARYTRELIIREIITSFFLMSKEKGFCKTLRICLHYNDFEYYNLEETKKLLEYIDKYLNN